MTVNPGDTVVLTVLVFDPNQTGSSSSLIEEEQVCTVRTVFRGLGPNGTDAFTAAVENGTAPGIPHLGNFTEDQIVRRVQVLA